MTLGLPVGAVINCADNSGAKSLFLIEPYGFGAHLNRLPDAGVGDMVVCSVKKGKPELRKKSTLHPFTWSKISDPYILQPCLLLLSASGKHGVGGMVFSCTLRCVYFSTNALPPLTLIQDNAGVIVNPKGEMKGSAITGPVAKECVRPALFWHHVLMFTVLIYLYRRIYGHVSHQMLVPWFEVNFLLGCGPLRIYCHHVATLKFML